MPDRLPFADRERIELQTHLGSLFTDDPPFVLSLFRPPDVDHGYVFDGVDSFETCMSQGTIRQLTGAEHIREIEPYLVSQAQLDAYIEGNMDTPDVFAKMKALYAKRFPNLAVEERGHVKVGTACSVCFITPLPEADSKIQRLPRFGLAYTFEKHCGNFDLAANANLAGERILQTRLKLVLEQGHSFMPKHQKLQTPLAFAQCVAEESLQMEHLTYLAMRLLLTHHLFFTWRPVVLQIFKHASGDRPSATLKDLALNKAYTVEGILDRHGMASYQPPDSSETMSTLVDTAIDDIVYLISRTRMRGPFAAGDAAEKATIKDRMEGPVRLAVALLCGGEKDEMTQHQETIRYLLKPRGHVLSKVSLVDIAAFRADAIAGSRWDRPETRKSVRAYFASGNPENVDSNDAAPFKSTSARFNRNPTTGKFPLNPMDKHTPPWHIQYARAKFTQDQHILATE